MSEEEGSETHRSDQGRCSPAQTQTQQAPLDGIGRDKPGKWPWLNELQCWRACALIPQGRWEGSESPVPVEQSFTSHFIPGQLWKRTKGRFFPRFLSGILKDRNSNTTPVCASTQFCAKGMQRCGLLSIRKPKSCSGTISESPWGSILGPVALACREPLCFTAQRASLQLLLESAGAVHHWSIQEAGQLQTLQVASLCRIIPTMTKEDQVLPLS